ncbi:MAG: C45 family autoproteolytic acyltransferase/hydrolase [Phycisphaerae bacterium]
MIGRNPITGPSGANRKLRSVWLLLSAALLLAAPGCVDWGEQPITPPAEGTDEFGTFRRVGGIGVLTVWGDPHQRGLAHGRLLAQGVLDMVDTIGGSSLLIQRKGDYERVILPMMGRFVFEEPELEELQGILDGVREKLGDKAIPRRLGRPITLGDLKAANTAGDWYRQACSSFVAWGSRTRDGHVWVGHNFDFMPAKAFFPHQMIVVRRALGVRKAWATASAPGFIGCITGINSDGVFATTHDVFLPMRPVDWGYAPRLLVLRRLLENCSGRDLAAQALPVLEASRQMFDNAMLLAAPVADGTPPAVVFECGVDRSRDKGVTVRRPQDNDAQLGPDAIVCANHFRKRAGPRADPLPYRYPLMRDVLNAKAARGDETDFAVARKTMGAARLPITVHTVIADLTTMDFWYAPGEFLSPPGPRDFVRLPMKEWLEGR